MLGKQLPCSQREITLVSESPSMDATFFCEYPMQCLYVLSLFGYRPVSMEHSLKKKRGIHKAGKFVYYTISVENSDDDSFSQSKIGDT